MNKIKRIAAAMMCVVVMAGASLPVTAAAKPGGPASTMETVAKGKPYQVLYDNTSIYNPQTHERIGGIEQYQWMIADYISGNRFYGTVAGGALVNVYGYVNRYNVATYPG